ncbi:uncharacterized protein PGTG_11189 [Puccinia graminis f. sp. tritici CRL 75-36-700-3]|uniref:Uncharacterized protein n=1 Tax=Puccinia graminis f. sp. tritici (strain CRL 75-36-700-3 / race SCCL) TaxID=418459 RepID=E3KL45_PUCGT|nr:uncharacterized protein PGTG_11189 [Puccinia graminis f. sp. tritici CRL 75-36-700-3]EFP85020.2 hypothetical protein PGTG_11189 [Puccinia graminis f. sp. tritici CRL 75-36-700-3]
MGNKPTSNPRWKKIGSWNLVEPTTEIELTGAYQTFAEPILWISRGRRLPWDPHSRLARSAPGVYYLGESVRIFKAC